jgi:hypothetical protein
VGRCCHDARGEQVALCDAALSSAANGERAKFMEMPTALRRLESRASPCPLAVVGVPAVACLNDTASKACHVDPGVLPLLTVMVVLPPATDPPGIL